MNVQKIERIYRDNAADMQSITRIEALCAADRVATLDAEAEAGHVLRAAAEDMDRPVQWLDITTTLAIGRARRLRNLKY